MAGAGNEVRIILRAIDEYSKTFNKLNQDVAKLSRAFDPSRKVFKDQGEELKNYQNNLMATRKAEADSVALQKRNAQQVVAEKQRNTQQIVALNKAIEKSDSEVARNAESAAKQQA